MANECYNLISIWGNKKAISQVEEWKFKLRSIDQLDDKEYSKAFLAIFYPDTPDATMQNTGCKWVVNDEQSIGPSKGELGLKSAWNNPLELEQHLAKLIFPFDPNVIVHNDYNLDNNSRGISITSPISPSEVISHDVFREIDEDEYEDIDGAIEARDDEIEEEIQVAIDSMISEKPALKRVFKKNRKSFNTSNIPWEDL